MANPTKKTTSRQVSIKITAGSALERLTEGRSFTKTVHEVFEMYARAMGDQPVEVVEPTAPQETFQEKRVTLTLPNVDGEAKRFRVLDIDGITVLDLSEAEMLKLAAEQYPSGLVPILDERMIASEEGEIEGADEGAPQQEPFDYEQLA